MITRQRMSVMNHEDQQARSPASLPAVSVIVPVFDDRERLELCLRALIGQDYRGSIEIIVVDNGSTQDMTAVKAVFPKVRWLFEAKPGSYNARNTGIAAAVGEILAFTDSDCVPELGWLSAGVAPLTEAPAPGFVGGRVDLFTTQQSGLSAAELFDLAVGFPQKRFVEEVHFAMTANMLTSAAVMRSVGGFHGGLKSGGDREWGTRAWDHGFPGRYVDEAVVRHPTRSTPAEVLKRIRRVAGGERDRHPGWARCLAFCARHLLPPRSAFRAILEIDPAVASPLAKFRAMAFAYGTRGALIRDRLRLQLGAESTRS